jgi:hypothetical protein
VEDSIKLGNVRNGMLFKMNDCKSGADPPKNVSGSTGIDTNWLLETRQHSVKIGNGLCIMVINFSNAGPFV